MFRFASLYGIGKKLNRTPFYDAAKQCQGHAMFEFQTIFPNLVNLIKPMHPSLNSTITIDFGQSCCIYEDPSKIKNSNEKKYMALEGNYFQSYKYFDAYKDEILELYEFKEELKDKMDKEAMSIFGNDTSHKLCIYIRRGDFVNRKTLETREDFLIPAMTYISSDLHNRSIQPISLVFLGIDKAFARSLVFNRSDYHRVYFPKPYSRGEDLYFGSHHCDSFLLSSSGSTFGWWIAYFLPSIVPVYYHGLVGKVGIHRKDAFDYDQFPETWIRLLLDNETGVVYHEKRWYYEERGWPRGFTPANIY